MEMRDNFSAKVIFEEKSSGFERLIMLCDGVFAIAMTLLVLDIKLPEGITKEEVFTEAWDDLLTKSIFYLLTFVIVAGYWMGHRRMMIYIKRQDVIFTMLTFLFLAFVVFFPVSFNVVVGYGDRPQVAIFYVLVLAGGGLSSFLTWMYASWKHRLIDQATSQHEVISRAVGMLTSPAYFCLSLLLLLIPGMETRYVFFSWALTPVVIRIVYFVLNRIEKRYVTTIPAQQKSEPPVASE